MSNTENGAKKKKISFGYPENSVVEYTLKESDQTFKFDVKELPQEMLERAAAFGVARVISNALIGFDNTEAQIENINRRLDDIKSGSWQTKSSSKPKGKTVKQSDLLSGFANMSPKQQQLVRPMLLSLGIPEADLDAIAQAATV